MGRNPHELAEERSLAAHRVIAARLEQQPEIVEAARARVQRWLADGTVAKPYALAWAAALAGPLDGLITAMVDESETGRANRQCTPFAGALDPQERWRIWAEVRRRWEADEAS